MLFKKSGWLRKSFDELLLQQLEETKQEWIKQKNLVEKSFEPSEDIIYDLKIAEAKYFYLLREAKNRKVYL